MPESQEACWSCGAARAPAGALCPACGKVQPPPPPRGVLDKFAALAQEFLEQALEDREKLLEAKMEGGPEAVARLAEGVRGKKQAAMDEIAKALREPRPSDEQLRRTAELLARLRYYARYLDEVEG